MSKVGIPHSLMIFGISVSLALHLLAIVLFYIIGFVGMDIHLYERNVIIARSEFFLIFLGLSVNFIILKRYLRGYKINV